MVENTSANNGQKGYYSKPEGTGTIKISEEVIASIAAVAVGEIPGIESLVGGISSDIAGLFGVKTPAKGIRITFTGDTVAVEMFVTVRYGYLIPDISKKLQNAVATSVEAMTGLKVTTVNIHIAGVNFEKERRKSDNVETAE